MTIFETLCMALEARGERDVTEKSASKFRKYTCTYYGARDGGGKPPRDR